MRRALAWSCLPASALAQAVSLPVADPESVVMLAAAEAALPGTVMHGSAGSDFTTQYFFRGIFQENQGAIAEPWLELGMPLYEDTGPLRAIDLVLGQWNSLHDGPSGSSGPQSIWYENDLYIGLDAHLDERWTLGGVYTVYYSPNGRFGTVQEVAVSLGYDDQGLLGEAFSGLQPSVLIAFETQGQADATGKSGVYGELAVAPSFALGALGAMDVTLALPCKLGFNLGDYYEDGSGDSAFGYFDVGGLLHAPLTFLPARAGPWEGFVGVHALWLGDSNEGLNGGDAFELIVSCGFSTSF